MKRLNTHNVALTLGAFLGGWHLVWSILVALGVAQALYDFVLWAHMIHLQIVVGPFDVMASATLVVVTAVAGYAFGWIFAYLWNMLHA